MVFMIGLAPAQAEAVQEPIAGTYVWVQGDGGPWFSSTTLVIEQADVTRGKVSGRLDLLIATRDGGLNVNDRAEADGGNRTYNHRVEPISGTFNGSRVYFQSPSRGFFDLTYDGANYLVGKAGSNPEGGRTVVFHRVSSSH
jgi:hypothetical protein